MDSVRLGRAKGVESGVGRAPIGPVSKPIGVEAVGIETHCGQDPISFLL